ncbi:MAG: NAD-dependent deacylase, partial [Planctomycetes bacterium]|nr:NAD-dependent deacylase [Planctomycetota bacterium]
MSPDLQNSVCRAVAALQDCRRLLVITGAGSSADSGIPTFRGDGGMWKDHSAQELASPEAFQRNPDMVWDWYRERRLKIAGSEPHEGHRTLALLQEQYHDGRVIVATTNEDDLLERAGVHGSIPLHGSLFDTSCSADCGWMIRDNADNSYSFVDCPQCGAAVRPGSIWYGEAIARRGIRAIQIFAPDACIVIGSSSLVQPVAGIAPELALSGNPVIEINAEDTPLSNVATVSLRGHTIDVLPQLVDGL